MIFKPFIWMIIFIRIKSLDKNFQMKSYKEPRQFKDKDDWRRDNVDLIIKQIRDTIIANKPEVEFGISPLVFGEILLKIQKVLIPWQVQPIMTICMLIF